MKWEPPALPAKKPAVYRHPHGVDLWDGPSMDMHAMRYAEACVAAERERCAAICKQGGAARSDEVGDWAEVEEAIRAGLKA